MSAFRPARFLGFIRLIRGRQRFAQRYGVHHVIRWAVLVQIARVQPHFIDLHLSQKAVGISRDPLDQFVRRSPASRADASQCQVRPVIASFGLEPEFRQFPFEGRNQIDQRLPVLHACPDHSRPVRGGKASGAAERHFERRCRGDDAADCRTDIGDFTVDDIPEKLKRKMQIVRGHPFDAVLFLLQVAEQATGGPGDFRRKGNRNEGTDRMHEAALRRSVSGNEKPDESSNMEYQSTTNIGDRAVIGEPPGRIGLEVPPFVPHPLIRGGHLQTIFSLRPPRGPELRPTLHWIELPDGDVLALHDDSPPAWQPGLPSVMLVHGLCGCSLSPYMIRLARRFTAAGVRVFRLELRGCGAARDRCVGLTHAGRSDDCLAALGFIAELTGDGPLWTAGISLGGNQLLLAAAGLGEAATLPPPWAARWQRLVAVSPPIDLVRCSENMQRRLLRGYNRYFIRHLMSRLPLPIRQSPELLQRFERPWPRTLRELDERITAPLSGFRDALDYYTRCSAVTALDSIRLPTLIVAAGDDPIVPVDCFHHLVERPAQNKQQSSAVSLMITPAGGHVGFLARGPSRFWIDEAIESWFRG